MKRAKKLSVVRAVAVGRVMVGDLPGGAQVELTCNQVIRDREAAARILEAEPELKGMRVVVFQDVSARPRKKAVRS